MRFLRQSWLRFALTAALSWMMFSATAVARRRPPSRPLALLAPAEFAALPFLGGVVQPDRLDYPLLAAALFHATNDVRRAHGLKPFLWNPRLEVAADLQANSVSLDQTPGHINVIPSLLTLDDRLDRAGLVPGSAAENAAMLSLVDIEPANGIRILRRDEGIVLADETTGRIGQPHTYASIAGAAVKAWMDSPGHRANILNPTLESLGCSARLTNRISSIQMIACIQVFYTAPRSRVRG